MRSFVPVYCNLTIHYQRKGVLGEARGGIFFPVWNQGEGAQQTLRAEWGGEVEMQGNRFPLNGRKSFLTAVLSKWNKGCYFGKMSSTALEVFKQG